MAKPTLISPATAIDHPLVHFGREVCGDLATGLRREWLVTNGLGGYASGTLAGVNTRRYHGLLVAALTPPVERTMLVGGLIEWATYNGQRYPLSTHEYGDGTIDPHGYRHLQSFRLQGALPVWTFALGNALLERRVWMAYGANTTYVMYRLLRGTDELTLEITPLVTYRDFHSLNSGQGWRPGVEVLSNGAVIRAWDGARPFQLLAGYTSNNGRFAPGGDWYWNFRHREEAARGLDDRSDLYAPGNFTVTLLPGASYALVLTTETQVEMNSSTALATEEERQLRLLRRANAESAHPVVQQLTLAADQFIVERWFSSASKATEDEAEDAGQKEYVYKTVIAGYPWFNDWGRDTMISLPGLTLATGRSEDAAAILSTFAQYVVDGLLPNNFPDHSGVIPGYNTVDATLWYVLAVYAYYQATHDMALVDQLLPVLRDIIDWHRRGTRYHIGVDPADGLLHAGEPGVQLTWMDAKVGDWVVTPRTGKPVEINALWYNVLCILTTFLTERGDIAAQDYSALADEVHASFRSRFSRADRSYLADVVDGPDGDDFTMRPNQIFAVSLPFPLVDGAEATAVVDAVGRTLLTSYGLRSLSPGNPAYHGDYGGDQRRRDGAYHQGTVWTWLMGAYVEAHYRVSRDLDVALALLQPFEYHLRDAGLGSISEILEGDPPHLPNGCFAQAWGVAEVLRVWRKLER
jgi:predicted glycogen debranching enzyme